MGLLALPQLMFSRHDRRRRRRRPVLSRTRDGPVASRNKRKGSPSEQQDDYSGKKTRYSVPDLPEDIWHKIHSLLELRDAARASCVSRSFLDSWRSHPSLTLNKDILRSKAHARGGSFSNLIDCILRNHSGIGVKRLKLELYGINCRNLDSWLQIAVTPGIEELTLLRPCKFKREYNFPCSVLSDGVRNSIRRLDLGFCAFRPTAELGPFRSLSRLYLSYVHIMGAELECFLSNSLSLELLNLKDCDNIICLKIPVVLQHLTCLRIYDCKRLQMIECKTPNLSSLHLSGDVKFSIRENAQMKDLIMDRSSTVYDARAKLPSIVPTLETLVVCSDEEVVDTPTLPSKFVYLKHLTISITSGLASVRSYDYFSLISFLDASPSLETLLLDVLQLRMEHESVLDYSSCLRQMSGRPYCNLKAVKVRGFSFTKSLVELICHILKNAVSLERLTLDTLYGCRIRCSDKKYTSCSYVNKISLMEAHRTVATIRAHVENKVPSTVKLTVLEPCSRCHAVEKCD